MDKRPLILVSICAVVLLVLGSLSNVVGYQTVQTSQQNTINERINQRELLFQTIVDIVNNKDIQGIILKSQMSRGIFPTSEFPVVTKQQLRQMYFLGLLLSKFISTSRVQSMVGKYQLDNQEMQKEISTVIEKDSTLNAELTQLKNSECDCENENSKAWSFPILCEIIYIFFWSFFWIAAIFFMLFSYSPILKNVFGSIGMFFTIIAIIFSTLGDIFNCSIFPYGIVGDII